MSDTIQRIFQILRSPLSIMTLFRPATLWHFFMAHLNNFSPGHFVLTLLLLNVVSSFNETSIYDWSHPITIVFSQIKKLITKHTPLLHPPPKKKSKHIPLTMLPPLRFLVCLTITLIEIGFVVGVWSCRTESY